MPVEMRLSGSLMFIGAVLLSASSALAGALEDCAAAFDRQDYAAALRLCRPLASKAMPARRPASAACITTAKASSGTMPKRRNGRAKQLNRATRPRRPTSASCTGTVKACRRTLF